MTRGYHTYRGHTSWKKVLLIVVLLLVIFGAVICIALQNKLVFEENGGVHLGEQKIEAPVPSQPVEEEPLEIVYSEPIQITQQLEQRKVSQCQAPLTAGYTGWAVTLKTSDGYLHYASELESVLTANAVARDAVSLESLKTALATEGYHVARISCFHDSVYSMFNMAGAGLCQPSGYVWFDNTNSHWLDASKSEARAYLVGIVQELADLGFDEIVLEDFAYPVRGKLYNINYAAMTMTKQEALTQTVSELRTALAETHCRLSVMVSADLLVNGAIAEAGQERDSFAQQFDALYVPTTAEELPNLTATVEEGKLMPILTAPIEGACLVVS